MKNFDGVVIYTDGSAKPNPGMTGWGVHGYFYMDEDRSKKHTVAKFHTATAFGYIHQNEYGQNPRAYAIKPVCYLDGYGTGDQDSTNNYAEMLAFYKTIFYILDATVVKKIQVLTDSEYLRKGITEWRAIWEQRDFIRQDGLPVSNAKLWRDIFSLIDRMLVDEIVFEIDWVKGHSDKHGNVLADQLATIAMLYNTKNEPRTVFDLQDAKSYWKNQVERHPFLDFSRLYFNSQKQYNIMGQYFLANPGKDDLIIGKRIPDTSYCVVRFKNYHDPVIETIRDKQYEVAKDLNTIMAMRLDRVFQPDVYDYIEKHGEIVLSEKGRNNISLNFIDQRSITLEINPPGLSIRAVEALVFLESKLDDYLHIEDRPEDQRRLKIKDITSEFYEAETDPKRIKKGITTKLKKEIDNQLLKINIPVEIIQANHETIVKNIPVILGLDVLRRNGLKKIEENNPRILLLTWYESSYSIRYACVIETSDAIGIWSNYYADRLLF
jgi:ribonuclease HI